MPDVVDLSSCGVGGEEGPDGLPHALPGGGGQLCAGGGEQKGEEEEPSHGGSQGGLKVHQNARKIPILSLSIPI